MCTLEPFCIFVFVHIFSYSPLQVPTAASSACFWVWEDIPPLITANVTARFVDESGDGLAQSGETITFNITVVNTGKVMPFLFVWSTAS